MKIEHVLFSSKYIKMFETCQRLAFTYPIVVLKSGLKNNWMRKLDRVNRLLVRFEKFSLPRIWKVPNLVFIFNILFRFTPNKMMDLELNDHELASCYHHL